MDLLQQLSILLFLSLLAAYTDPVASTVGPAAVHNKNSGRGGGVSRPVSLAAGSRKRLAKIVRRFRLRKHKRRPGGRPEWIHDEDLALTYPKTTSWGEIPVPPKNTLSYSEPPPPEGVTYKFGAGTGTYGTGFPPKISSYGSSKPSAYLSSVPAEDWTSVSSSSRWPSQGSSSYSYSAKPGSSSSIGGGSKVTSPLSKDYYSYSPTHSSSASPSDWASSPPYYPRTPSTSYYSSSSSSPSSYVDSAPNTYYSSSSNSGHSEEESSKYSSQHKYKSPPVFMVDTVKPSGQSSFKLDPAYLTQFIKEHIKSYESQTASAYDLPAPASSPFSKVVYDSSSSSSHAGLGPLLPEYSTLGKTMSAPGKGPPSSLGLYGSESSNSDTLSSYGTVGTSADSDSDSPSPYLNTVVSSPSPASSYSSISGKPFQEFGDGSGSGYYDTTGLASPYSKKVYYTYKQIRGPLVRTKTEDYSKYFDYGDKFEGKSKPEQWEQSHEVSSGVGGPSSGVSDDEGEYMVTPPFSVGTPSVYTTYSTSPYSPFLSSSQTGGPNVDLGTSVETYGFKPPPPPIKTGPPPPPDSQTIIVHMPTTASVPTKSTPPATWPTPTAAPATTTPKQKHYKLVFIQAPTPEPTPEEPTTTPAAVEVDEKTFIYVLHKKPTLTTKPTPAITTTRTTTAPTPPQVFFIGYNDDATTGKKDGHGGATEAVAGREAAWRQPDQDQAPAFSEPERQLIKITKSFSMSESRSGAPSPA